MPGQLLFTQIFEFERPYLTALSGLIRVDDQFYVIADDQLSLYRLPVSLKGDLNGIRLFQGSLPSDTKARKKRKPDLETLVYLNDEKAILCVPSGSSPVRHRAALVKDGAVRMLLLDRVYAEIRDRIPELNIEGAVIVGSRLRLFQRGNGSLRLNGVIELETKAYLENRLEGFTWTPYDLGSLNGAPLGFTDACIRGNETWFLAAAESTESTIADGAFVGAMMGCIDSSGVLSGLFPMDIPFKPEGLHLEGSQAYVVTDADDPSRPSSLYRCDGLPGSLN
jgi:hypothetical protein